MFDYTITNLSGAEKLVEQGWPTKVVTLLSPHMDKEGRFDDMVDQLHILCEDIDYAAKGFLAPRKNHVEQILRFTENLTDDDRLLVHCHYGISRSTASMIAVLVNHGTDEREAFNLVAGIRPAMVPNRLIIDLADWVMNLGGALKEADNEWQLAKFQDIKKNLETFWDVHEHLDPITSRTILRYLDQADITRYLDRGIQFDK